MLKGKTVLITGASRGIGLEIAKAFASKGAKVLMVARDKERLKRESEETNKKGGNSKYIVCDLTKENELKELAKILENEKIDVLVNNAGIGLFAPIDQLEEEDFDKLMALNVRVPFLLSRLISPKMVKQGSGHIVNICSTSGLKAYPYGTAYCASKFALRGFSEALCEELRGKGVKVTAIFPGSVETDFVGQGLLVKEMKKLLGFSKLLDPKEVAKAVVEVVGTDSNTFIKELVVVPPKQPGSIEKAIKEVMDKMKFK